MPSNPPPEPPSGFESIIEFARRLGPESEALVQRPAIAAEIAAGLRVKGRTVADVVLKAVHAAAASDAAILGEFIGYWTERMSRMGLLGMSLGALGRRMGDTEDVVMSVMTRFLPDLTSYEFRGERQWQALMTKQMRNKAKDYGRWLRTQRRREDRRRDVVMDNEPRPSEAAPSAHTLAANKEEYKILEQLIPLLSDRDQDLVRWTHAGVEVSDIAARLSLTNKAVLMARTRAHERLKRLRERRYPTDNDGGGRRNDRPRYDY